MSCTVTPESLPPEGHHGGHLGGWGPWGLGSHTGATVCPPPQPYPDRSHPEVWLGPSLRETASGVAAFQLVSPIQLSPPPGFTCAFRDSPACPSPLRPQEVSGRESGCPRVPECAISLLWAYGLLFRGQELVWGQGMRGGGLGRGLLAKQSQQPWPLCMV